MESKILILVELMQSMSHKPHWIFFRYFLLKALIIPWSEGCILDDAYGGKKIIFMLVTGTFCGLSCKHYVIMPDGLQWRGWYFSFAYQKNYLTAEPSLWKIHLPSIHVFEKGNHMGMNTNFWNSEET